MIEAAWSAVLAVLLAGGAASGPVDEFGRMLARLASPLARERAAAERWLAAHLERERYPELTEAALAGDAEVRARLARVLSAEERHLGLSLLLCAEAEPALAALGREAVRAGVARSEPRLGEPALRGDLLAVTLRRVAAGGPPRRLRLDARLSLEELVAELELAGELPLGLALDPDVATKTIKREEEPLVAPWDELLLRLARATGVELESHGLQPLGESAEGAFLHFTSDPARTGVEVLGEWLVTVGAPADERGDEGTRTRAARNLAASGFAPALGWLGEVVRAAGDPAAREGLLQAAARGRVAPALLEPAVLESLLAEAVAAPGPRSARILCALARTGCFAADGAPLAPRMLSGFEEASAPSRWARLAWFEQNGCASPEAAAAARALLADPTTPAALRLQALHTALAQAGAVPPEVAGFSELFRLPLDEVEVERLCRALRALSLEPPARDPALVPADWTPRERTNLLQAWLWNGASEPVAAHLAGLVGGRGDGSGGRALADALRPWLARGEALFMHGALRRAGELAPVRAAELERIALLLGLVPAAEVPGALKRGGWGLSGPGMDLELVAALAGYPVEIEAEGAARETLLSALTAALQPERAGDRALLLDALERSAQGLYAAGRDAAGDELVRKVLRKTGKSELGRRLERQHWPAPPSSPVRDVARELGRYGVPDF